MPLTIEKIFGKCTYFIVREVKHFQIHKMFECAFFDCDNVIVAKIQLCQFFLVFKDATFNLA